MDTQTALALVERHAKYADYAAEYGEPGYDEAPKGVIFANWNDVPRYVFEGLERRGFALEWSDEWITASETGKAYRQQPNSYGWKPYFVVTEHGDVIGGDEIECGDQLDWYVDEYLLNNPRHANMFKIDLAALGFVQYNGEYETGFHPGQNDDPKAVFAKIQREMPDHDVVFDLTSVGQFDQYWKAWTRPQGA